MVWLLGVLLFGVLVLSLEFLGNPFDIRCSMTFDLLEVLCLVPFRQFEAGQLV